MKNQKWEMVWQAKNHDSWTLRLKVPGGWLYRNYSVLLTRTDPDGTKYPLSAQETMCFVPSVPRSRKP